MLRWLPKWLTLGMAIAFVFVAGVGLGTVLFTSQTPLKKMFGYTPPPASVFMDIYHRTEREYIDPKLNGQGDHWDYWQARYEQRIHTRKDLQVAASSMLASLNDEYTRFLPEKAMNEQLMQIDAELTGIGVHIITHNEQLMILSVINNSPAKAAKLMAGDVIHKIDGEPTKGITISEAADLIRGKAGTTVNLAIKRGEETLNKAVIRDAVHLQAVYEEPTTDDRVGYIRLSTFLSDNLMEEFATALAKIQHKQALILDLRSNFGGLLDNALKISDRFLGAGTIVNIQSTRWGKLRIDALKSSDDADDLDFPLVVLIDGGSASASEIVSAALHDNKRATLMGTTSFGKGLVQRVIPLANGGGLNLSISKYLTPNKEDIHRKGIDPDVVLPIPKTAPMADANPFDKDGVLSLPSLSEEDTQRDAAVDYLVKQLEHGHA